MMILEYKLLIKSEEAAPPPLVLSDYDHTLLSSPWSVLLHYY